MIVCPNCGCEVAEVRRIGEPWALKHDVVNPGRFIRVHVKTPGQVTHHNAELPCILTPDEFEPLLAQVVKAVS